MRSRRALLYMPGHEMRKIEKAVTLGVDCVCIDLEDSVPLSQKEEARQTAAQALKRLDFGSSERLVRINPAHTALARDDLKAVLPAHPDGIVAPKVESPAWLQWLSQRISSAEDENGWEPNSIALIAIIESARAVVGLTQICSADVRLAALIMGAEDLAADIGATRTPAATEVLYARSAVVLHAAAFNLDAIDIVHINFHDLDSLRAEAAGGAALGFTGKQVIHPSQVDPVQRAFTPDDETIARAQSLLEEYRRHEGEGRGAYALPDGTMVDMPLVKMAENVLSRARAAGKIV